MPYGNSKQILGFIILCTSVTIPKKILKFILEKNYEKIMIETQHDIQLSIHLRVVSRKYHG